MNTKHTSSKEVLENSLIHFMLNVHRLHLNSPFGNEKVSLDFFQVWILSKLNTKSLSIKQISQISKIDRRVVNSNIRYLFKYDLIEKQKDNSDGREVLLSLSDYGKSIFAIAERQFEGFTQGFYNKFSIKQERSFSELFGALSLSISKILGEYE